MNKNNPLLTVIIPTYNRIELLKNLLIDLLKIKPVWAEIVIIDNNSNDINFIEEYFKNEIEENLIRLVKNSLNVEGDENILRSFEYSNGEWIWVLGDDDFVFENAFRIIEEHILENDDVFFYHFNWEKEKYLNTNSIYNFKDLLNSIHSLGDLNFISSNVFNKKATIQFVDKLHFYQLSATPILGVALFGIDSEVGSIKLSNKKIITNGFFNPNKSIDDKWDVELILSCLPILSLYPFNLNNKVLIIKEINKINTFSIGIKSSLRDYLKHKSRFKSVLNFKEVTRLKVIYGSIINKLISDLISLLLFLLIKPLSLLYLKLKKSNKKSN
jgi:glycosyltransferase involved in cell wall biosynthesis